MNWVRKGHRQEAGPILKPTTDENDAPRGGQPSGVLYVEPK